MYILKNKIYELNFSYDDALTNIQCLYFQVEPLQAVELTVIFN